MSTFDVPVVTPLNRNVWEFVRRQADNVNIGGGSGGGGGAGGGSEYLPIPDRRPVQDDGGGLSAVQKGAIALIAFTLLSAGVGQLFTFEVGS